MMASGVSVWYLAYPGCHGCPPVDRPVFSRSDWFFRMVVLAFALFQEMSPVPVPVSSLNMSEEGGLELVPESFMRRAMVAFSSLFSSSNLCTRSINNIHCFFQ